MRTTSMAGLGIIPLALLCAPARAAGGDAGDAPPPTREIVVKGEAIPTEETGYSTTTLSQPEIRDKRASKVEDLLRFVPGVNVRDFGLGGVASSIVIRGFGNGGHGGDLGVVLDGIPLNEALSHADGYVDLSVVVPLEIGALTVFRGPVSALYGNFNRGGLLALRTRQTGDYLESDVSFGSFATADAQVAAGASVGAGQQVNLAGQMHLTGGFRPDSGISRGTVAGRYRIGLTDRFDASVAGRVHRSRADSASYLTRTQFAVDRHGKDPRVVDDGADKDFATARLDLGYTLSPAVKLLAFGYTTQQDFTRWFTRPVDATNWRQREETYDRDVYGAGTSLNGTVGIGGVPVSFVAGVETFREATEFQFHDGLVARRRTGPASSNRRTRLNSVSAFAELDAAIDPLLHLSIGLRYDRFTGGCRRLAVETTADPCGPLNKESKAAPKLGVRSQLAPWLQLRGSYAEGFQLPDNFIKYSVGGQPLDVNLFRQYEVGARLTPLERLELDIAAYSLQSTGEVRTIAPGVFENFGGTSRRGIEASLRYAPTDRFDLTAVYGHVDARFKRNANPAFNGNRVPGVPRHTATVYANWSVTERIALNGAYRHVGDYPVAAANTLFSDSYDLFDAAVYYRLAVGDEAGRLYLAVDNLANTKYATSVSLIGGVEVLAPGTPRAVRVGGQFGF